jgi:hypothetical protein
MELDLDSPDADEQLFEILRVILEPVPTPMCVPALAGMLVRELVAAVAIHGQPVDVVERVLRIVRDDTLAALEEHRTKNIH